VCVCHEDKCDASFVCREQLTSNATLASLAQFIGLDQYIQASDDAKVGDKCNLHTRKHLRRHQGDSSGANAEV